MIALYLLFTMHQIFRLFSRKTSPLKSFLYLLNMKTITKSHCQGIVQVTLPLTTIPSREAKASLEKELIDHALSLVPDNRAQTFISAEPDKTSVCA